MLDRLEGRERVRNSVSSPKSCSCSNALYQTAASSFDDPYSSSSSDDKASIGDFFNDYPKAANRPRTGSFTPSPYFVFNPALLEPTAPLPFPRPSTLDRSHLTIALPPSYPSVSPTLPPQRQTSTASHLEDVAEIDTELNLTLLSLENHEQTNPLLYSRITLHRLVAFRSLPS